MPSWLSPGVLAAAVALLTATLTAILLPVRLILSGKLVPRTTYEDVLADRDAWRDAHRVSEQARTEQSAQVAQLLEGLETVQGMIRSLPPAPRNRGR